MPGTMNSVSFSRYLVALTEIPFSVSVCLTKSPVDGGMHPCNDPIHGISCHDKRVMLKNAVNIQTLQLIPVRK